MKNIFVSFSFMGLVMVVAGSLVMAQEKKPEPVSAQSLYKQGYQLEMQAKYKEAIAYFDKALAIDSTHLLAWCYKGRALNCLERWSEAITVFDSALSLDKDCIFALAGKAIALKKLGGLHRNIQLATLLNKAVGFQPKEKDAEAYNNRGLAYAAQGNAVNLLEAKGAQT